MNDQFMICHISLGRAIGCVKICHATAVKKTSCSNVIMVIRIFEDIVKLKTVLEVMTDWSE